MFGAEIVQSSYDFDTQKIGPYHNPVEVHCDDKQASGNAFSFYKFYEIMNQDEQALAVFNVCNAYFGVLRRDRFYERKFIRDDWKKQSLVLPDIPFEKPLDIPEYRHIGWVKTYQQCKAVYTYPWKLIQDVCTGELDGFKTKLEGEPLVNPPLSLYKELINTEYRGVYFDTLSNKPVFIN